MKKRYSKTLLNEREVRCTLLDPKLEERGFASSALVAKKKFPFSQKRALCLLYGRSARSRFEGPLSPQEIAMVHLMVQKNVLQDEVVEALRDVLSIRPEDFYEEGIYKSEGKESSRILDAVDYIHDDRRIRETFPEMFGGKNNDHHIIPRKTWPAEFKTGRREGNTLRMNTSFHSDHWHGLYGVRHPLEIDRNLYFEIGYIDLLSKDVRSVVANVLKLPVKDFYKEHLLID